MRTQVTTSSPKLFIGLDIHKKSWKFHFMTDIVLGSGHTFPPKTDLVNSYVNKNYPGYEVNYYRSHAGKNSKAVIFKVGRKLLSKVMAVIKTEIPYSIGVLN